MISVTPKVKISDKGRNWLNIAIESEQQLVYSNSIQFLLMFTVEPKSMKINQAKNKIITDKKQYT